MLFFFVTTTDNIRSSPNRVVLFLLFVLFICSLLPSTSNAYPFSSSSLSMTANKNNIRNRRWIMSNEEISNNRDLDRDKRGTGFYIVRHGDYLVFIPDSRHHFTKNLRPYIGRRR